MSIHFLPDTYKNLARYPFFELSSHSALLGSKKKNMTAYYHKNIQLLDAMGTPFLRNLLPSFLLTHSDNIFRVRKRKNMNDPRDHVVYAKTSNNLHANNAKPNRSPKYSNCEYNSYQLKYMHQNDTQLGHTNQT